MDKKQIEESHPLHETKNDPVVAQYPEQKIRQLIGVAKLAPDEDVETLKQERLRRLAL